VEAGIAAVAAGAIGELAIAGITLAVLLGANRVFGLLGRAGGPGAALLRFPAYRPIRIIILSRASRSSG